MGNKSSKPPPPQISKAPAPISPLTGSGLPPVEYDTKPNWRYWSDMQTAVLRDAVALSCNIDPRSQVFSRYWQTYEQLGRLPRYKRYADLHDRYEIATERADELEVVAPPIRYGPKVNLPHFATWAQSIGWKIPAGLKRIAKLPAAKSGTNTAPEAKAAREPATPKPISPKERDNLLRIIGALYEVISGDLPGTAKLPSFKNQAQLILLLTEKYGDFGGLGKRNLEEVLPKAKALLAKP